MRCDECRELFSEYLDGRLPPEAASRVERHLATCAHCTRDLSDLRAVLTAMREMPRVPVPEGFVERVHARVAAPRRASVWCWAAVSAATAALALVFAVIVPRVAERALPRKSSANRARVLAPSALKAAIARARAEERVLPDKRATLPSAPSLGEGAIDSTRRVPTTAPPARPVPPSPLITSLPVPEARRGAAPASPAASPSERVEAMARHPAAAPGVPPVEREAAAPAPALATTRGSAGTVVSGPAGPAGPMEPASDRPISANRAADRVNEGELSGTATRSTVAPSDASAKSKVGLAAAPPSWPAPKPLPSWCVLTLSKPAAEGPGALPHVLIQSHLGVRHASLTARELPAAGPLLSLNGLQGAEVPVWLAETLTPGATAAVELKRLPQEAPSLGIVVGAAPRSAVYRLVLSAEKQPSCNYLLFVPPAQAAPAGPVQPGPSVDALRVLTAQAGVSLLMPDTLAAAAHLALTPMPPEQALTSALQTLGLKVHRDQLAWTAR